MSQRNQQLKKAITSLDYSNLSAVMSSVQIYLSSVYPLNELIKFIYNTLAYLLIEDENDPK